MIAKHPNLIRQRRRFSLLAAALAATSLNPCLVAAQEIEPHDPAPLPAVTKSIGEQGVQSTLELRPVAGPILSGLKFSFGTNKTKSRNNGKRNTHRSVQSHNHSTPGAATQHRKPTTDRGVPTPAIEPAPADKPAAAPRIPAPPIPNDVSLPPTGEPSVRIAQEPTAKQSHDAARPRPAATTPATPSTRPTPRVIPRSMDQDGWVARDAIDSRSPLRDPGSRLPNPPLATKSPSFVTDEVPVKTSDPAAKTAVDAVIRSNPIVSQPKRPAANQVSPVEPTRQRSRPILVSPTAPAATPNSKSRIRIESVPTAEVKPRQSATKDLPTATPKPAEQVDGAASKDDADTEFRQRVSDEADRHRIDDEASTKNASQPHDSPSVSADAELKIARRTKEKTASDTADTLSTKTEAPAANAKTRPVESEDRTAQAHVGDLDMPETPRETLDYVGIPAKPFQVSKFVGDMKPGIERVLQYFYDHPEQAPGRSNWGMMHAIMVYGVDTRCVVGDRSYSTIAWIAGNNLCRGQRLLEDGPNGLNVKSGVGLQGHQAQMLAIFSLCDVPANYPMYAGDTKYSINDVVQQEMKACKSGEELTFTLIGLSHYLDTDQSWIANDGQRWDFERLIREELSQPIVGAACGGTHRLMGFAHALRNRRIQGKPIDGQWARAERFLRDYVAYTYRLQNPDGSMSTEWFEGRGDDRDVDRKIQTTGHMVEFLLTVTPDSQLQNPQLVRAVRFLLVAMHRDLDREWKIGPKGHALRSLAMYHDRVYKSGPAWQRQSMARRSTISTRR
ncbi:MAG: hypothetical protein HKN47_04490 [Pirellulaceae bacterium]|nr:hypothetical protein [Pirellulaceae bacterium]